MKTYHHTKVILASAVARNWSKHSRQLIWVFENGARSVASMKFPDTSVIQVSTHSELPVSSSLCKVIQCWYKGKLQKIE